MMRRSMMMRRLTTTRTMMMMMMMRMRMRMRRRMRMRMRMRMANSPWSRPLCELPTGPRSRTRQRPPYSLQQPI